MPSYSYVAVSGSGERVSGELRAADVDAAAKSLQADGHTVISIKPLLEEAKARGESLIDRLEIAWKKFRTSVPLKNQVFFTRQLSTMFSAGMTLERSLLNLAQNERHHRLKKTLLAVAADIQNGTSLSDAMSRHPGVFNRLYVSLIKSGEVGGTLAGTLDRLADYLERVEDTRRKVVSALYYPVFVILFLGAAVLVLVLKVAPMFNNVYKSFGADLPAPTAMLMASSNFLLDHFFLGALMALVAAFSIFSFSLTDTGRHLFDLAKLRLPIFGSLVLDSVMARFARTFGLLLSTSVPVLDSLHLVGQIVDNAVVEKGVLQARGLIKDGTSIHVALQKSRVFPSILVQLASTGEETGEIDQLLLRAAEFYEKQVDALVSRLTSLIEPMLIVLMGVVVGTLVIVIYLPIFELGLAMKRGMG